jgi:hypothetical protein
MQLAGDSRDFRVNFRELLDALATRIGRCSGHESTHIFGVAVAMIADASHAARTVDHAVTLVDDVARVIVVVDQRGRVTMRPAESYA